MDFDSITLDKARQLENFKWRKYPRDVIPSWVADMDFPVAPRIRQFLEQLARRGDLGYADEADRNRVMQLFCERMEQRHGWRPEPELTATMVDIVQGIYVSVNALSQPGDNVIVQVPAYHPILNACRDLGREMLMNPLQAGDSGWRIDFDQLEAAVNARTRVLMLVNPHNPSGRVITRAELERLADVARRHELAVVADEVHADLRFEGSGPHVPFASLDDDAARRTVTFNSASKSHNLGGTRCCVVHFGSEALRERFSATPRHMLGGGNILGYRTTRVAWEDCDDWLAAVVKYLEDNRDFMAGFLAHRLPDVRWIPNQATYLAWLDFTNMGLKESPADWLLREARVACYPGSLFGPGYGQCLRLNFATSRAILEEKLERIARALDNAA